MLLGFLELGDLLTAMTLLFASMIVILEFAERRRRSTREQLQKLNRQNPARRGFNVLNYAKILQFVQVGIRADALRSVEQKSHKFLLKSRSLQGNRLVAH
jgi:hypothetical protein